MKTFKYIVITVISLVVCGVFLFWYFWGAPVFSFSHDSFWGGTWSQRHEEAIKSIFFNPNKPTKVGSLMGYADYDPPLVMRARSCDLKGVLRLLDVGADVNYSKDRELYNSAIGAVLSSLNGEFCFQGLDILKEFLKRGANTHGVLVYSVGRVNSIDAFKLLIPYCDKEELNNALVIAIKKDNVDLVGLLLKSGADPNATNNDLREPNLLYAIRYTKNADIIYTLLRHGADKNSHKKILTFEGEATLTPCYLAQENHYKEITQIF